MGGPQPALCLHVSAESLSCGPPSCDFVCDCVSLGPCVPTPVPCTNAALTAPSTPACETASVLTANPLSWLNSRLWAVENGCLVVGGGSGGNAHRQTGSIAPCKMQQATTHAQLPRLGADLGLIHSSLLATGPLHIASPHACRLPLEEPCPSVAQSLFSLSSHPWASQQVAKILLCDEVGVVLPGPLSVPVPGVVLGRCWLSE